MVVRLHPGQSKQLATMLQQKVNRRTLCHKVILEHFQTTTGVVEGKNLVHFSAKDEMCKSPGSICGLEISFSSLPQDVDVKLISGGENLDVKGF